MEKQKDFDFLTEVQLIPADNEIDKYLYELVGRCKTKGDIEWNILTAFQLGRICGIRQERSRRKKKQHI